jgi:hypothetical protein
VCALLSSGCINDANNVKRFLTTWNYNEGDIVMLTDDATNPRQIPTKDNIVRLLLMLRRVLVELWSRSRPCSGWSETRIRMTRCSFIVGLSSLHFLSLMLNFFLCADSGHGGQVRCDCFCRNCVCIDDDVPRRKISMAMRYANVIRGLCIISCVSLGWCVLCSISQRLVRIC